MSTIIGMVIEKQNIIVKELNQRIQQLEAQLAEKDKEVVKFQEWCKKNYWKQNSMWTAPTTNLRTTDQLYSIYKQSLLKDKK